MLTRFSLGLSLFLTATSGVAHAAPSTALAWSWEGTGGFDFTGTSVGTAGDANCDGYADLIVGSPQDDEAVCPTCASADSGTIAVWFGGPGRPAPNPNGRPDWFTYIGNFGGLFGAAVAAGDVNGDGCDDVIASEWFPSFPTISPQKVHVFLGPLASITRSPDSNQPPPDVPEWTATLFQRTTTGLQSPVSVAAGDVNGDGLADVIVGQPEASNGESEEGVVLVWLGSQNFANDPDGTTANVDWMAESNQANAHLGESVASAMDFNGDGRDEILAGAPDYNGHGWAFLWLGSSVLDSAADGTPLNKAWSLTLGAPSAGCRLGQSVAAAGDFNGDGFGDLILGAPLQDTYGVNVDAGEALLVLGGNPVPASDAYAFYFGPTNAGAQLGSSVATAGDVNGDGLSDILVGEPLVGLGTGKAGQVHLILGIRGYSGAFNFRPGIAATYSEAGTINNLGDKSRYGASVGTAGDWNGDGFSEVIIGAPAFGQSLWGKAFVYMGSGETLASLPAFGPIPLQAGENNGLGVAFAGDINHDGFSDYVMGAPNYESTASQDAEGIVRVAYGGDMFFEFGGREGDQDGAQLGSSVRGAGDVNGDGFDDVIAGAPNFDHYIPFCIPIELCRVSNSGQARIYHGSATGLSFTENTVLGGPGIAEYQFGYSVAGAGDVNGDGFGDVIVGAPYASSGPASDGRALLYLGSAGGVNPTPVWFKNGGQANARFGIAVAGAGDVNRDGYSDVVIGADGYNGTGAALVYLGQPGGLAADPVRTYTGIFGEGWSLGAAVAGAGDLNRDGYSDIAVGAPSFYYIDDPTATRTGYVAVYHGGPDGPGVSPAQSLTRPTEEGNQRFGSGVAGAGDVNGDGFGDLIVGAQWFAAPAGFAQGKAYLYHGGSGFQQGITSVPARTFQDCPHSFCDFGRDVAGAGDFDADGFSDVLIGAFRYQSDGGAVFLHLGNGGGGMPVRPLQASGFSSDPRALLGIIPNWLEASMSLHSPAGRSRVQLEVEVDPFGQEFDGAGRFQGVFLDNGIFARDMLYQFMSPGGLHQWRARLRSRSPLFGRSRWVSLPGNAPRELDFRVFSDSDGDGVNQAADVCRFWAQVSQADTDGDGRGNECECGDQNGDGLNTVSDLVAINNAIYNPAQTTPLCDANGDGNCNVSDIVAVNIDLFTPGSLTTCSRQPVPGP